MHHQQSKKKKKKKTVRFCDSDNLERVKFFRREDPPNMRNLTQPEIQQAQKQAILNPHRMSSEQLRQLEIDRGDALKQGFQHRMSNQKELKKMHAKIKWSTPVQYKFDQKYMLMDPSDSKQIEVQKLKVKNNFHGLIPANQAIINPAEAEVKRFLFTDKAIAKLNACTVIESDLEQAAKKQQDNRIKDLLLTLEGKSEEQVQQLLSDYQLQFSYEQFKILLNQTKQKHRVESSQPNSGQMDNKRSMMNGLHQQLNNNFVPYPTNSYIMPGVNNNNGFIPQNFRNDKNKGNMTQMMMMNSNNGNMYPNMMVDINMPMINNTNNNNPYIMNKLPQNNINQNNKMMMMTMQDPQFQQRKSLQNILIKKKPHNYKTQPCRNFHSASKCARGDTCNFIHDYKYIGRPVPQQSLNKFRGIVPTPNTGSINISQVPVIKFSEQLARENQANK